MLHRLLQLQPLSLPQHIDWYAGSLVYGCVIALIAADTGAIRGQTSDAVPVGIFLLSWVIGVVGLRVVVQSLGPHSTIRDLLQLPKWLKRR
jgi:hypothetical protein